MDNIKIGIYENLDEQEYHDDPALGSSDIKNLLISPFYFWYYSKLNPKNKTNYKQSYKIGSALHTAILEPEEFSKRFTVNRKYKECKTKSDTLGTKEFQEVQAAKKEIKRINAFEGQRKEVSIFWVQDGVRCKARLDILDYGNCIIDLKTTKSVANKDIRNCLFGKPFSYNIQAAHYIIGLREVKKQKNIAIGQERFTFLFVTKHEPIEHYLADIEEDIILNYSERVTEALNIYKNSLEKWEANQPWRPSSINRSSFCMDDMPPWVNYDN